MDAPDERRQKPSDWTVTLPGGRGAAPPRRSLWPILGGRTGQAEEIDQPGPSPTSGEKTEAGQDHLVDAAATPRIHRQPDQVHHHRPPPRTPPWLRRPGVRRGGAHIRGTPGQSARSDRPSSSSPNAVPESVCSSMPVTRPPSSWRCRATLRHLPPQPPAGHRLDARCDNRCGGVEQLHVGLRRRACWGGTLAHQGSTQP